jgi:hypothetical protein
MKKIPSFLCGLTFSAIAMAQVSPTGNPVIKESSPQVNGSNSSHSAQNGGAPLSETSKTAPETLILSETEFDFGKIPQGKPVIHVFEFKNTGSASFSLDKVQASCGCTTPEWNKDTIAPGATSKIKVGYNALNEGPFAKPVTITYNGNQVKQIIIKGEVWKTPETSAPLNNTVTSLINEQ